MVNKVDIFELANFGIKLAEKKYPSFKCAEIFVGKNEYTNIEFSSSSILVYSLTKFHN